MKRVQLIRYTSAAMAEVTGRLAELMVNLSNNSVVVHNGATEGGIEMARADAANMDDASSTVPGRMGTAQVIALTDVIAALVGETAARIAADDTKTDKIVPATVNNLAILTSGGNLGDSGETLAQASFPSGTIMVFAQAAAPVHWTQEATNDRMMRVVSAAGAGTGGADDPILNDKIPSHTHVADAAGAHTHSYDYRNTSQGVSGGSGTGTPATITAGTTGSNGSHTHTINANAGAANWAPKYIDVILAAKD